MKVVALALLALSAFQGSNADMICGKQCRLGDRKPFETAAACHCSRAAKCVQDLFAADESASTHDLFRSIQQSEATVKLPGRHYEYKDDLSGLGCNAHSEAVQTIKALIDEHCKTPDNKKCNALFGALKSSSNQEVAAYLNKQWLTAVERENIRREEEEKRAAEEEEKRIAQKKKEARERIGKAFRAVYNQNKVEKIRTARREFAAAEQAKREAELKAMVQLVIRANKVKPNVQQKFETLLRRLQKNKPQNAFALREDVDFGGAKALSRAFQLANIHSGYVVFTILGVNAEGKFVVEFSEKKNVLVPLEKTPGEKTLVDVHRVTLELNKLSNFFFF